MKYIISKGLISIKICLISTENLRPVSQIQLQAKAEINKYSFRLRQLPWYRYNILHKTQKLDFVNISLKSPRNWVRLIYNLKP